MAYAERLRPLQDRILVSRVAEEAVTPGGIIIPDNAREKPARGVVVAAGNGRVMEDGSIRPLDVKERDVVLFGAFAGTEIKMHGEQYLLMREEDILAVVESR